MYDGARRLLVLARAAATARAADLTDAGREPGVFSGPVRAVRFEAAVAFIALTVPAARLDDFAAVPRAEALPVFAAAVFLAVDAFFRAVTLFAGLDVPARAAWPFAGFLRAGLLPALSEGLRFRIVAIAAFLMSLRWKLGVGCDAARMAPPRQVVTASIYVLTR